MTPREALAWAIDEAATWRGALSVSDRAEFDADITRARAALDLLVPNDDVRAGLKYLVGDAITTQHVSVAQVNAAMAWIREVLK